MSGRIVALPEPAHSCDPPERDVSRTITFTPPEWVGDGKREPVVMHPWMPDGAVWECDCGQRWRATYPYVNLFAPTWVKVRTPRARRPGRRTLWPWRRA